MLLVPRLVGRFELGKDRRQVRVDRQFGGPQLLAKGDFLLVQRLPLSLGGNALALAPQRLKLLPEIVGIGLEGPVGRESLFARRFQLGFFVGCQDGIMMVVMMPSATGRSGIRGCIGVSLGESSRNRRSPQGERHESDAGE